MPASAVRPGITALAVIAEGAGTGASRGLLSVATLGASLRLAVNWDGPGSALEALAILLVEIRLLPILLIAILLVEVRLLAIVLRQVACWRCSGIEADRISG